MGYRLRLADLGYFNLGAFEELGRGGAYYLSRYKVGTRLFYEDGSALDLAALLQGCWEVDTPVLLGATYRLDARLMGVRVPREVVETDKLTVEQILTEENAEIRRLMIERYGQERFICDAKAEVLDKRGDDELIRIPLSGDPEGALVALKVRCPSSGAIYVLRVPPDQTKVRSALAWTFGYQRVKDYKLQAET